MVETERFADRRHKATRLDDLEDPPRFGQVIETVKDAFVHELREFFDQPRVNTQDPKDRNELPTVRKYAVGYAPGTDPYETTAQILNDHADVNEKLPHVAVTAVEGRNNRLTAGRPFIAQVQSPPRVESVIGPFALGSSKRATWIATLTTPIADEVNLVVNDAVYRYTPAPGESAAQVLRGVRTALSDLWDVVLVSEAQGALVIESNVANDASLQITSDRGFTVTQTVTAGSTPTDVLVFLVEDDDGQHEVQARLSEVSFADPGAATAAEVAAAVQRADPRLSARATADGRVRVAAQRRIELLERSTPNALQALGWSSRGTGGVLADGGFEAAGVGAAVLQRTPGTGVTAYLTLDGARYAVVRETDDRVRFEGEAPATATGDWFAGAADSFYNDARPPKNRRHIGFTLQVTLSILAEDPNTRDELRDLVTTQFAYQLELKHFELIGRGTLDPDVYPDEHWQISIAQDIASTGESRAERQGDMKGPVFESRVSVPVTLFWYQDREVRIPSGPRAGEPWVIRTGDVCPVP